MTDEPILHYLDIASAGGPNGSPHPLGQFRLAADVVDQVHHENVRLGHDGKPRLATAFPGLAKSDRDPMGRTRIFGDAGGLEAFRVRLEQRLQGENGKKAVISAVAPVPSKHGMASFHRDRAADREVGRYSDRALQRAQRKAMDRAARGEVVRKAPMDSVERVERMAARAIEATGLARAHLELGSRSTGQRFCLFVAARIGANGSPAGGVDIYGLSRRDDALALPHF